MSKILEAGGWTLKRIAGSHHLYVKAGERKTISLPIHGSRYLKPGLAAKIARDAKVTW